MAKNMEKDASGMDIQDLLSKINFPARKQEIINQAKSRGLPQEAVSALNGIPDREYMSAEDVTKEIEER